MAVSLNDSATNSLASSGNDSGAADQVKFNLYSTRLLCLWSLGIEFHYCKILGLDCKWWNSNRFEYNARCAFQWIIRFFRMFKRKNSLWTYCYDRHYIILILTFSQGHRSYLVGNSTNLLGKKDVEKMKELSKAAGMDSTFVSTLLTLVFSDDVLKVSSAGGRKSNFNKKSHTALDQTKLRFVEGNILTQFYVNRNAIKLYDTIFSDLFAQRIKYDGKRKKKFTKFVNKKCNSLRRKWS